MAKSLVGIVTSDKRDKSITVSITSRETHPLYRKQYSRTRKYTAHDEKNEAHEGDRVEIAACRPISKTKNFTLVRILERSKGRVDLKDEVLGIETEENQETAKNAEKADLTAKSAEAENNVDADNVKEETK